MMASSSSTSAVICSIARTPIGKFGSGSLSSLKGSELGSFAIKGALQKLQLADAADNTNNDNDYDDGIIPKITEAIMGNVVSAGMGQAPCRQAVLGAGLPASTICTTVNKVCASGMKSVMLAATQVQAQQSSADRRRHRGGGGTALLAGGFESMSNIPYYLPRHRKRDLGHLELTDGLIHDGLWDVYNDFHMGMCAEKCAIDYDISRNEQDEYALESYKRAKSAISDNLFEEVIPVELIQHKKKKKKGQTMIVVDQDEEPGALQLDKLKTLQPAFDRSSGRGTVTAANSSSLNDGACAMVIMSEMDATKDDSGGIAPPLLRILGFADAEQDPVDFPTAPSLAVPLALQNAGLTMADVDYHEINEAFSVVAIANQRLLKIDPDRLNVLGGAVALGHPIGMSGARILGTLYDVLKHKDATIGCASICNGGGGASAMVVERLN